MDEPRTDREWLAAAVEHSRRCPPAETAYSVGAILVAGGAELARGYSRESDPTEHAEEAALRKVGEIPPGAVLYSSLEPCSRRKSRPLPCAELIVAAGIQRVVYAWREPPLFVDGDGATVLREAGVEVVELPELAGVVRQVNAHLLP
ncbi:MAG: deaminase [Micromonosporaceae bacterium]